MLISGLFTVMNWVYVISNERNKRRGIDKYYSTVPLVSLIFSAVAYRIYPFTPKVWIGIIPAVDIGNWILVIGLPWALTKRAFKKGQTNKASDATSEPAQSTNSSAH